MLTIENCTFEFKCPKTWQSLQPIAGIEGARSCEVCHRLVHRCLTDDELRARVALGDCVAIERADEGSVPRMLVGDVRPDWR
ncbi:MAG: hypothetical protein R3E77_00835 [Steroidobacteraceae bacterium]